MKFEHTEVWGFEHAIRGMRNPKNSWNRSDSSWEFVEDPSPINPNDEFMYVIGENDMKLAQALIRGGSEHRKFLRQIFVSVDITAPLYWWKEFDTYKVGTVANSTSTMHKIASYEITADCFEIGDYNPRLGLIDDEHIGVRVSCFIDDLEQLRQLHLKYLSMSADDSLSSEEREKYRKTAKEYWKELIRWLPESWLQTRTVTMNYENLLAICRQRRNHKLNEWSGKDKPDLPNFISWARELPYAQEFIFIDEERED